MVHKRIATKKEVRSATEMLLRSYHLSGKSPTKKEVSNVLNSFGLKMRSKRAVRKGKHRKSRR